MSELALTLLRLGFLVLLWVFVFFIVSALRRDLAAPSTAALADTGTGAATTTKRSPRRAKESARRLAIVEGDLAGTVVPLASSPITLGRAADNTVVLDDEFASSRHAKVYPYQDSWVVQDLGSTNGTWIDRTRITTPTVLAPGQQLRVGRTVLELRA